MAGLFRNAMTVSEAAHLITSNSILRTASNKYHSAIIAAKKLFNASLIRLLPPLQTLANFGIPSTLSSSVNLILFFLH